MGPATAAVEQQGEREGGLQEQRTSSVVRLDATLETPWEARFIVLQNMLEVGERLKVQ